MTAIAARDLRVERGQAFWHCHPLHGLSIATGLTAHTFSIGGATHLLTTTVTFVTAKSKAGGILPRHREVFHCPEDFLTAEGENIWQITHNFAEGIWLRVLNRRMLLPQLHCPHRVVQPALDTARD